ncbi:MAG: bifunctional methylenetetrahydrofolate dehydrogenase/methenyltetrahydrofolate cyclohydrolase FolD [Alphaproteobacteria bacterium]
MAQIIDGKAHALALRQQITALTSTYAQQKQRPPGLVVVLVGGDPASQVYVRNKEKAAHDVGFYSHTIRLPENVAESELLNTVTALNQDERVDGILVQLPLPRGLDSQKVVAAIAPHKDVDGLHPLNAGKLMQGMNDGFVPCTPLGCMILLKRTLGNISGKKAVVMGRSILVGKPMLQLLLAADCTVTAVHSRTQDIITQTREADILVAAIGRPEMVKGDWLKQGATIIDVGINRLIDAEGKQKLVGDVDFMEAEKIAAHITPVPGGVGPMTIACLLANTLKSFCLTNNLPEPIWYE